MSATGRDFWEAAISMTPAAQKMHSVPAILSPYEASKVDLTLFVYCQNHEDTVASTLDTIVEAMGVVEKSYEIIVIDDCSKDRSPDQVRGFMTEYPKLPLVLRINMKRKGIAQNYYDCAFIGCGKYFRMIYADNAESVETMVDVLRTIGEADVVVPYYISMYRKTFTEKYFYGSYAWILNLISGNEINNYTSSQLHLRYNIMRWHANTQGFAFQADMLCRLLELGFTLKQVPCRSVPLRDNQLYGSSFMAFWSIVHALIDLSFRRISGRIRR
jgi:hypothetical protein